MRPRLLSILSLVGVAAAGHFIAWKMFDIPTQLEAAVFAGLILVFPILRAPLVGVYAIFLILPFIPFLRRLYYLVYARPSMDPLIMTGEIILILIFAALFFEFRQRRGENRAIAPYMHLVTGYFIYMALRVVFYNFTPIAQAAARFKYYGPPVLLFFIGIYYAGHVKHLKRLWLITAVIGVAALFYGLKQLYIGYSTAETIWYNSVDFSTLAIGDIIRPYSLFTAPVAFADYLQLAIIAVLMWSAWLSGPLSLYLLATLPLLFYGILITSVRSSWIGAVISFVLWLTVVRVRRTGARIALVAALVVGYGAYESLSGSRGSTAGVRSFARGMGGMLGDEKYVELLVDSRSTAISDPLKEHSFQSRMRLWRQLIRFSREPVTGLMGRGLGALKADSLYFTYLAEFGYPGLLLILTILTLFIMNGLRTIDHVENREVVTLARGITTMNLVFAVVSVTGTHIHYFPGDVYFWFWNGVLVKLSSMYAGARDKGKERDEGTGDT